MKNQAIPDTVTRPPERTSPAAATEGAAPRHRARRRPGVLRELGLDALMLGVAGVVSLASGPAAGLPREKTGWLIAFSLAAIVALALAGAYRPRFGPHFLDDVRSILGATAVAALGTTFVRVLFTDDPHAAGQAVREWLFAATYLSAGRGGAQLVTVRRRRRGEAGERTLIVGAGRVGHLVADRLRAEPEFGLRPVAFLDDHPLAVQGESRLPVLGSAVEAGVPVDRVQLRDRLGSIVREFDIRHVIVTFSLSPHELTLQLIRTCQGLGLSVSIVPRLFEGVPDQTDLERLVGLPLAYVHPSDPRGWQFAVKYAFDRLAALIGILLLTPIMLAEAVAIRATIGRPVLFRQRRVGIDGREFDMFKFRTLKGPLINEDDDATVEAAIARGVAPGGGKGEVQASRLGLLLRRYSLDELPQLFNVLLGDMSLIGPRPERVQYAHAFDSAVERYTDRSRVKSGITGWAQVHGLRGRTSLTDRVEADNYYIENWSLWLDVKVALLTLIAPFRDRSG